MREIFRRVAALLLICLGGCLMAWPGGKLIISEPVDFRADYENKYSGRKKSKTATGLGAPLIADTEIPELQEYMNSITRGKTIEVSGPQWESLNTSLAHPEKNSGIKEREYGIGSKRFIFHPDDMPFSELKPIPLESLYISINNAQSWVRIRADYAGEIYGLPDKFLYPLLYPGLGMIIGAFVLYFAIPRRNFSEDSICYPRGSTVTGPDIMGLIMTGLFFVAPFPIVWGIDPGADILSISKGWIWLCCAMWLLALISSMLLLTGYRFSDLTFRISREGFVRTKGRAETLFRWEDIESCEKYRTTIGRKISNLLFILGTTLQAAGMAMMLRNQEEFGIYINHKNGSRIKVMGNDLAQFDEIIRSMKERGIKIHPITTR